MLPDINTALHANPAESYTQVHFTPFRQAWQITLPALPATTHSKAHGEHQAVTRMRTHVNMAWRSGPPLSCAQDGDLQLFGVPEAGVLDNLPAAEDDTVSAVASVRDEPYLLLGCDRCRPRSLRSLLLDLRRRPTAKSHDGLACRLRRCLTRAPSLHETVAFAS